MSRTSDTGTQKTPTSENHSAKSPNDSHYVKNKAIQSPVNRYRVSELRSPNQFALAISNK